MLSREEVASLEGVEKECHFRLLENTGSTVGRSRYAVRPAGRKTTVTQATKEATSDPSYKRAAHKLLIENMPFSRLTQAEQRAFNAWRLSVGQPPLG